MKSLYRLSGVGVLLCLLFALHGCELRPAPEPGSTTTRPSGAFDVESTSPKDGDTAVAEDSAITVTFTRPVNAETLTSQTFSVSDLVSGHPIAGRIGYDDTTRTAMFTPDDLLSNGKHYEVTITRDVTDTTGTRLPNREVIGFMVREFPLVREIHTSPANNATGVALTSGVRVDFPARLDPSTVTSSSITLLDGTGAAVSGTVLFLPAPPEQPDSIFFQPAQALQPDTTYTATLSKDLRTETDKTFDQDVTWIYTTAPARTATLTFGELFDDSTESVAVDSANNVFVVSNIQTPTDESPEANQVVVTKTDGNGNIVWESRDLPDPNAWGSGITVDAANNVIISGTTSGLNGELDIFFAKYDGATGKITTSEVIESAGDDFAYDVAADAGNNLYFAIATTGAFLGKPAFGNIDVVVHSTDPTGAARWTTQFGTEGDEAAVAVAVNSISGTVFVTGGTFGALGDQTNAGGIDMFVTALAVADGVAASHKQIGTAGDDFAYDIAVNETAVFIDGASVFPDLNFASSGLVVALDPTGTTLHWQKEIKAGELTELHGIAVDDAGGVYIAGWIDDGDEPDMPMIAVAYKLDDANDGAVLWQSAIPVTTDADANHMFMPHAITSGVALDADNNMFISGTIHNGALIDGRVNRGLSDGFLVKLGPNGIIR